jgi:hypothetical protein
VRDRREAAEHVVDPRAERDGVDSRKTVETRFELAEGAAGAVAVHEPELEQRLDVLEVRAGCARPGGRRALEL